ncbi:xyloglucan O-acetyltransferase 1-like [Aristolochia californica]|uniref:xyloglucan O-acetyltransferase 1-like n=1 Tax=Aristolochia californica TaxID=171875 RepID=UPI0035DDFE94
MGSKPLKDQSSNGNSLTRKLLPWALYALFPIAFLRLYFYPLSPIDDSGGHKFHERPISYGGSHARRVNFDPMPCNYTMGQWVPDKSGPQYNGTSCSTIKDGQNCMAHGRPDTGYLHWRWRPAGCKLPRFNPFTFLRLLRNKHLAFVGDSMARNQLESLLCLVSTASAPILVYRDGEENKFRRWHVRSHNVTISVFWSPFLVKGIEKSASGPDHNQLYVDLVDERWASEISQIDTVVFSIGHWFLHPAVYLEKGSVLGCHYCPGQNHTEIGFYDVFRKAIKTTLEGVVQRSSGKERRVIVTTFSPSHFEGEWDKYGACARKEPFKAGEKALAGMVAEMRKIEVEEVTATKSKTGKPGLTLEALDVTELSMLRPDGHPGPYMYPNPFGNGVQERVQNDCVHWCLPGPIDTWNEIMLDVMKRWQDEFEDRSSG